jgi:para-aminobenzoate synthetase
MSMRCLIIDNYDSFTWNLADYVAQVFECPPLVVRNDQHSWRETLELDSFGCIIVSPGPGTPANPADVDISRDALVQDELPVLGVCLGHQALAYFHGGKIEHALVPCHGRSSVIEHDGSALFKGLPSSFEAVRYHSLIVSPDGLPDQLIVTARTESGLIMGLRHVSRPKWGVQFHPESILTQFGMNIICNFRDEALRHTRIAVPVSPPSASSRDAVRRAAVAVPRDKGGQLSAPRRLAAFAERVSVAADAESVFLDLFADCDHCFWLDTQCPLPSIGRFSFMGCAAAGDVLVAGRSTGLSGGDGANFLQGLERVLEEVAVEAATDLPFEFRGGYVGYLSYEMKAAFGAAAAHRADVPDAAWMRIDRFVAFDHETEDVWLVAVAEPERRAGALRWIAETAEHLKSLRQRPPAPRSLNRDSLTVEMDMGHRDYLDAIRVCKERIVDGESYEICLTNRFKVDLQVDAVDLYLAMRRGNPAPFGAFIRVGSYQILSTSPERLLKVDGAGTIETKPIKGTCPRSDDPDLDRRNAERLVASEKERAENLMIVDLVRNDLARVSAPGSVHVPKLMGLESFATVHQLVSTVASTIRPECSLVDVLHAVFPGGSITGAPKIRTIEIIDGLERSARGIYCGSIGYLGYNRIADINIAIRTLWYDGSTLRFGAGGAITFLSDAEDEFQEMLLKAKAVLRPIWQHVNGSAEVAYHIRGRSLSLEAPRQALPNAGGRPAALQPGADSEPPAAVGGPKVPARARPRT